MSQDIGDTAVLEIHACRRPAWSSLLLLSRGVRWPRWPLTDNVSRQWIYKLLARHRTEGEVAFEPRSRRPHIQPTAIPAATVELILRLRCALTRQGLDAGAHTIAWHLAEQHQLTVSTATIWRTLKRAGQITPEPTKKPKAAYVRFAAEQPNQMWQVDFTHYRLPRC
jgi:hypothetical protein